jgi:hypothetical protein
MNRHERRRGLQVSDIGRLQAAATCDCLGCELIRAGVCFSCAAAISADILRHGSDGTIKVTLCSGACREAVERVQQRREARPRGWQSGGNRRKNRRLTGQNR